MSFSTGCYGEAGKEVVNALRAQGNPAGDGFARLLASAGATLYRGNAGNDYLQGNDGADTYLFGLGSGQDCIYTYDYDTLSTHADTVQLGNGITAEMVIVRRYNDDLILGIRRITDQLVIQNYFAQDAATAHAVESICFADGTEWDSGVIKGLAIIATAGDDKLYGYAGSESLNGGLGNDSLQGEAGNDVFLFADTPDAVDNIDWITDFSPGQDTVHLSLSVFSAPGEAGPLGEGLFVANDTGSALDDNDYILYNTTTGALLYDADGSGQGVAVQFATLSSKPELRENDFFAVS